MFVLPHALRDNVMVAGMHNGGEMFTSWRTGGWEQRGVLVLFIYLGL